MMYSVWVGGVEVGAHLMYKKEAERVAKMWRDDGYDDVQVMSYEGYTGKSVACMGESIGREVRC